MTRLRTLARRRGCTKDELLADVSLAFLDREEAFERERERDEDEARYRRYRTTGDAFDHDAVAAWLDRLGTAEPLPPPHRLGRSPIPVSS